MHSCIPQDCGNHKDSFIKNTTHRALHRMQTKAHSWAFLKKAYLHVLELQYEGNTSYLAYIHRPMELFSRNVGCGCHIGFLPFSRLPVTVRKEVYTCLETLVAQVIPTDHLALVASRAYACGSKGLIYLNLGAN